MRRDENKEVEGERERENESRHVQYLDGILALTVGPLDVYAAADVDVARTVIHGHLVGPAHLVRHHKTRPASSVNAAPHAAD